MSNPFFSIIIPAYNAEIYLEKTLDSFFYQSFSNFEIIVINDGSTDNTQFVIDSFFIKFNGRLKKIYQHNQGASIARNNGVLQSSGEFVIFFDNDDYVEKNFLIEMFSLLKNNSTDMAFCGYDKVDLQGLRLSLSDAIVRKLQTIEKHYILDRFLRNNMLIWIGCAAYRKKMLITYNISFNSKLRYAYDQDFTIRALFYAETIGFTPQILSHYLKRPGSVVDCAMPLMIRDDINVYVKLKHFFLTQNQHRYYQIVHDFKIPQNIYFVLKNYSKHGHYNEYKRLLDKKEYRKRLLIGFFKGWFSLKVRIMLIMMLSFPKFSYKILAK